MAYAASGGVALITLALLFYAVRQDPTEKSGTASYKFLYQIRAKKDLEVDDTKVESSGLSADHVTNLKAGSVKSAT